MSLYSEFKESLSEIEYNKIVSEVKYLYLNLNYSQRKISEELKIHYSIVRSLINFHGFSKSKEMISDCTKRTNLEKYGVENPFQSEEIKDKIKQTNLERYGTECTLNSEEVKNKVKKTNLERYGTENPMQNDVIKDKIRKTMIKNYGVEHPLRSKEILNKMYTSNKEKYGVSNTFQLDKSKKKLKESLRSSIPSEVQEIIFNKENFIKFLSEFSDEDRTWYNIYKKLGYWTRTINQQYMYKFHLDKKYPINYKLTRSHYEDEISEFIKSIDESIIIENNKRRVNGLNYELDLYLPDFKLGIEFNGDYWHQDGMKESNYHQNKSIKFKDKNIFIYHIWEHEWNDPRKQKIIKSQICNLLHKNKRIIYARKCTIKEIDSRISKEFLDLNHLQGNINSSIKLGLFYDGELVSIMTFGKSRFSKSEDIELHRFANKMNCSVIGGASKLFKYFLKNYNYQKIVSYCDIAKGTGKLYKKLGFKFDKVTSPNYIWINFNSGEIKTRYQCQMKNEREIMESQGFIKVSDCGNYKFIYIKD